MYQISISKLKYPFCTFDRCCGFHYHNLLVLLIFYVLHFGEITMSFIYSNGRWAIRYGPYSANYCISCKRLKSKTNFTRAYATTRIAGKSFTVKCNM